MLPELLETQFSEKTTETAKFDPDATNG